MADYLLPNRQLKLEDQRDIFKLRSRTNKLHSNWGETVLCETSCGQTLNNEHILKCIILKEGDIEQSQLNLIYNGNIKEN